MVFPASELSVNFFKSLLTSLAALFLVSCSSNSIDSIIHNAIIYTTEDDEIAQAIAINDGKIVAIGNR